MPGSIEVRAGRDGLRHAESNLYDSSNSKFQDPDEGDKRCVAKVCV